jgi:membrane protease YdiL (CAAX protease family)
LRGQLRTKEIATENKHFHWNGSGNHAVPEGMKGDKGMESMDAKIQTIEKKTGLFERPWLALLVVIAAIILATFVSILLIFVLAGLSSESTIGQFTMNITSQILMVFIIAPFILRLPKGKRTFRQYLDDIGLSRVQPFGRLVFLGLSCYILLALSQAAGSFVQRLIEGQSINWVFTREVFNLSKDLPPNSLSLLVSFPSIFEEAVFRGIVLTVFLNKYSELKAIIFSSIGFGLVHLFNLVNGIELVWVLGQVVWAFILGLFYGYVFVRTRSLLPIMIVHYLGNVFIGTLSGYVQARTSIDIQAVYGLIFSFGLVPTTLMILWARFFSSRWLPVKNTS